MVRIKHRYLLLNILYPEPETATLKFSSADTSGSESIPYSVQFRQPSSDQLSSKLLLKLIRDGLADLFGDYGAGKAAGTLQIKYFSAATSTAIVRVSRDFYRLVWAVLTYMTWLPKPVDRACVMQVVRVSGTMRKAEEEAIRRARLMIRRAKKSSASRTSGDGPGFAVAGATVNGGEDLEMADGIEDLDGGIESDDGED